MLLCYPGFPASARHTSHFPFAILARERNPASLLSQCGHQRGMHSLCLGKLYLFILFKEEEDLDSFASHALGIGQVSGQKRPQIRQVGKWACGGGTNQERNWKCQQKVIRAKSLLPFPTNMGSNKAIKWQTIAKI